MEPDRRGLATFPRFFYDDVALLCSTEPRAHRWRLEVERSNHGDWRLLNPKIQDESGNISTADLELWDGLRRADPLTIERVVAESRRWSCAPRGLFAVCWDISDWYFDLNPRTRKPFRIRITDSRGAVFNSHVRPARANERA